MRRRHAAARVLRAVEDVHRTHSLAARGGAGSGGHVAAAAAAAAAAAEAALDHRPARGDAAAPQADAGACCGATLMSIYLNREFVKRSCRTATGSSAWHTCISSIRQRLTQNPRRSSVCVHSGSRNPLGVSEPTV